MDADTGFAVPGAIITYTLTYSNVGRSTAEDVVITDTLPTDMTFVGGQTGVGVVNSLALAAWNCAVTGTGTLCTYDVGDVVPQERGTVSLVVQINEDVAPNSSILNTAVISSRSGQAEVLLINNNSTHVFTISQPTALKLEREPDDPLRQLFFPLIWRK